MKKVLSFLLLAGMIIGNCVFAETTSYPKTEFQNQGDDNPSRDLHSAGEYHPDNPVDPKIDEKMQALEEKEKTVKGWDQIMSQHKPKQSKDPSRILHTGGPKELTDQDLETLNKKLESTDTLNQMPETLGKQDITTGPDGTSLMKQGGKNPSRHLHAAGDYHPNNIESPNIHRQMQELEEKPQNLPMPVAADKNVSNVSEQPGQAILNSPATPRIENNQ